MENVSVVLSFYNNEKTIVESIQSVLNQTYKKIELILIDDGSVDQSNYLIKKNLKKKKNIKIFKNKQNQGLAYSLNKAIKKTNSNLIFRMDADDISKKDRISKQVSFMNKNPKVDLLGSNAYYFDDFGVYEKTCLKLKDENIKKMLSFKNQFIHSSVVFRKSFFIKYSGYDTSLKRGQDHDLWIRGKNSTYANLKKHLVYHYKPKKPKGFQTYYFIFLIIFKNLSKNKKIFILFILFWVSALYLKDNLIYLYSIFKKKNDI